MNLAEKAFSELFPEKKLNKRLVVKYSRAFNPYNANVKYNDCSMIFNLSHEWRSISDEIKIGLIQTLLIRVYKENKRTLNTELYENFIKKIGDYSEPEESDPLLEKSFNRVNEKYFNGFMDKPNLKWGGNSFSQLGCYEYGSNTVIISRVLAEDEELLDYIMYHELMHKKHKFKSRNGRSYHHTKEFRRKEKEFDNPMIEEKLRRFLKKKKLRKIFKQRRRRFFNWF